MTLSSVMTSSSTMIFDIPELVGEIIKRTSDPITYRNCLLVNREWYRIGKEFRPQKRIEFLVHREYQDSKGVTHKYTRWPNGKFHGAEELYRDQELIGQLHWNDGLRMGLGWNKLSNGENWIPLVNNRSEGNGFMDATNGVNVTFQYEKGNRKKIRYYHQERLAAEDIWNSPVNFTRLLYSGQRMVREENHLYGELHGVHDQKLYLHGYEQPWYTNWVWALILILSFSLLLYVVIKTKQLYLPLLYLSVVLLIFYAPLLGALYRGARIRLGYEQP